MENFLKKNQLYAFAFSFGYRPGEKTNIASGGLIGAEEVRFCSAYRKSLKDTISLQTNAT